jgi:phosphomannomutase
MSVGPGRGKESLAEGFFRVWDSRLPVTGRSGRQPRWEEIFQGYDVRGRYPKPIGPSTGRRLGNALAHVLHGPFLVGRDTRKESEQLERALVRGLRASGAGVVRLGIAPTPEIAYHARQGRNQGLAVTPSHNPLGFVGVKGFSTTGRLFDREWQRIGEVYDRSLGRPGGRPVRGRMAPGSHEATAPDRARYQEDYLDHLTSGLESRLAVTLDTRGGATALLAPAALGRIGARVVSLTDGFSATFYGRNPEPVPETLGALRERIRSDSMDLGFAFDGDGDRCVTLDEQGHLVEPEMIALLLHRTLSNRHHPIVASADSSRILERHARTIRSQVGGRFVTRAMRRTAAEVGVERSGHFYFRRSGADSDGILASCLIAHAVYRHGRPISKLVGALGRIFRSSQTLNYPDAIEARRAYRDLIGELGDRATQGLDGVTIEFAHGWCLVRPSNTQPLIRCSFEASDRTELHRIERDVRQWIGKGPGR